MIYRKFGNTGFDISALGFGAMRLPIPEGTDEKDEEALEEAVSLLCHGFAQGINYVDTAYFYSDGLSEVVVGKALKRNHWRDKVKLSTKLPVSNLKTEDDFWRILEHQLKKLDTSYIDFYHFHAIGGAALDNEIKKFNLWKAADKARDQKLIRHLSFSFHDKPLEMRRLIDTGEFSSVLCQYNLLDIANEEMIAYAAERGLGTIAMGPVGGGRLAFAGGVFEDALKGKFSTPEVALRFVLSNPSLNAALSGMGSVAMVDDNVRIASDGTPLSDAELDALAHVRSQCEQLREMYCTGCAYCRPVCPKKIHIPAILESLIYHDVYHLREHAQVNYDQIGTVEWIAGQRADACVQCGLCETKCPQHLEIRRHLERAVKLFGTSHNK